MVFEGERHPRQLHQRFMRLRHSAAEFLDDHLARCQDILRFSVEQASGPYGGNNLRLRQPQHVLWGAGKGEQLLACGGSPGVLRLRAQHHSYEAGICLRLQFGDGLFVGVPCILGAQPLEHRANGINAFRSERTDLAHSPARGANGARSLAPLLAPRASSSSSSSSPTMMMRPALAAF